MKKYILILIALLACNALHSENIDQIWLKDHYEKKEFMIGMRDGTRLYTAVYMPRYRSSIPRPIILQRTPYGCRPYGSNQYECIGEFRNYYLNNYIIVRQDVRGRYMSEGAFENVRENPEDTYDTIDWLVRNLPDNNGRVGMTGCSYTGYYATTGAICRHPGLKAVSSQAPILDWFMGDDCHHNGVLMLMDTYFFGRSFYRHCPNPTPSMPPVKDVVDAPIYDYFLRYRTFQDLTGQLPEELDFWHDIANHPNYDEFWKSRTPAGDLERIEPAVLVVGGSFDTDDCYGALNTYKTIRSQSPETDLYFLYGPWYHGSWRHTDYFLDQIEYPFFSHYLEDRPMDLSKVTVIPSELTRDDSPRCATKDGKPVIEKFDSWPDRSIMRTNLFLHGNNTLSHDGPDREESFSCYVNDPANPVPYLDRTGKKREKRYMLANQRFLSDRDDLLEFRTTPIADTLKVFGPVGVDLFASTSEGDMDLVVKIIDEAPDGYQMLVRWDVMRSRFRNGYESPKPMVSGEIAEFKFCLNDIAHHFMPGHRLVVQIQSSMFPVIDLNPGKFVTNIYEAEESDFVESEIKIYHDRRNPSSVEIGILSR